MRGKKIMIAFGLVGLAIMNAGFQSGEEVHEVYTVKGGDTLWSISEAYLKKTDGDVYILQFMEDIKSENPHLKQNGYTLQAGEVLNITYRR